MIPPLDPQLVDDAVARALAEDLGDGGDLTSTALLPPDLHSAGHIESRRAGVLSGLFLAEAAFRQVDPAIRFEALAADGDRLEPMQRIAHIEGPAAGILTAERTALNFLGHLSGIATATRQLVDAAEGTRAQILDTRKTTPGLRLLEKYAVACGGGRNHRIGLFDAVLIKDNHLAAVGSIADAIFRARAHAPLGTMVEVEVETLDQLQEALAVGADIVMLDNMNSEMMRKAVALRNELSACLSPQFEFDEWPADVSPLAAKTPSRAKTILLEASGGITLANVREIAETGVDLISVGWITHSAPNLDVALELDFRAMPK